MKRIIFGLLILTLVFSVFAMNTVSAFAEGEDLGDDPAGTEETLPEDGGNEEGGEELPEELPEEVPENNEENNEENDEEIEGNAEELATLLEEAIATLGDLKDEFIGWVEGVLEFISNDETYSTIAGVVLAILAVICIPFLIALLIIAYMVIGAVLIVSGALMSVIEVVVNGFIGAMFIA